MQMRKVPALVITLIINMLTIVGVGIHSINHKQARIQSKYILGNNFFSTKIQLLVIINAQW